MNSTSSARCTIEPLVAAVLGGSGSFSMLAKRNAIGHEVNASTRLGDRLVGTTKLTGQVYEGGARQPRCSATRAAISSGWVIGAKWSSSGSSR